MAKDPHISNAAAITMLNALVDLLDSGGAAGYVEIRTGSPPATVELAATGTLLSTHTLSYPAFGNASDNNPGAVATAAAIGADASADASDTAGWFRAYTSTGTPVIQGTVNTTNADLIMNSIDVVIALPVTIDSWTIVQPESN